MKRLRGRLVTPTGFVPGEIAFDDRISEVAPLGWERAHESGDQDAERAGPLILPGFIDVHVHGGGGGDAMDGPEGVRAMAAFHARHGTTTLYPTTITNPFDQILAALRGIREVRDAQADARSDEQADEQADGPVLADIPGAHLEGPFISPGRLGAQPAFAIPATADRVDEVLETGVVRLVTLAPEVEGAAAAALRFAQAGARVSVGHTRATYDQTMSLIEKVTAAGGAAGFTHLFNAMGGLEGRAPGIVGAAFAVEGAWAELILDMHHVYAGSALAALAAKGEKLLLVTDAIRAAGLPAGDTELGGQQVRVEGGAARLSDGTLAGSVLTLDVALRNLVSLGVPLHRASHAVSGAPAAYMGHRDRGQLEVGMRADLVVLTERLDVSDVYVTGMSVFHS